MIIQVVCPCGFRSNACRFSETMGSVGCAVPVFVPGPERLEPVVVVQGEDEPNEVFDELLRERAAAMARERFGESAIPMQNLERPLPCPVCGVLEAKFKWVAF